MAQRLAFARASQNVAAMTALLDSLAMPSSDGVDKVYRQLKDILTITAAHQAESSLHHRVEVTISSPSRSKGDWLKATMEPPMVGAASSLAQILIQDRLSHLDGQSEPHVHHENHRGDDDVQSKCRVQNPRHSGRDDREGHSLNPEGLGAKVFGSNVCDTHFPRHFQVPSNIIIFNSKMNPIVWLEDYHLSCKADVANDDLFII
jgi:hypothetical protein